MNSQPALQTDAHDEAAIVAGLIERARAAMDEFESADQARVDEAVTALAWSIYEPARAQELAEIAVVDTGLGNVASKIIKNQRKTFGCLRDLMRVEDRRHHRGRPGQGAGQIRQAGRRRRRHRALDQPGRDAGEQGHVRHQGAVMPSSSRRRPPASRPPP